MRVYKFGCLRPTVNLDIVSAQMRLGHNYYNELIALEKKRRAQVDAILATDTSVALLDQEVTRLESLLEVKLQEVRVASSKEARRADRRNLTTSLRSQLKEARARRKVARATARKLSEPAIDAANEQAAEEQRRLRKSFGLYWGTYLHVEQAVEAARKSVELRFARWNGEGLVGVQIQNGMPAEQVFTGESTLVRIEPVSEDAHYSPIRGVRRRLSRTLLHIRVGSEGRNPVWATVPMILHRPFPAGSTIKRVTLHRRFTADLDKWSVHFVIDNPTPRSLSSSQGGAVAVDLGWRRLDQGIRSGYAVGESQFTSSCVVAERVITGLEKSESIRSIRDRVFNLARSLLSSARVHGAIPEWMREPTETLHAWRSQARLASLIRQWSSKIQTGEDVETDLYRWLMCWQDRNIHLWRYEAGTRSRVLRRRKEDFRVWASQLASRFDTLVLEDLDLRAFAQKKPDDQVEEHFTPERYVRSIAAPSELRLCLENAFLSRGRSILKVPAHHTTSVCSDCGVINQVGRTLVFTCAGCQREWDQDHNAGANILHLGMKIRESQNADITPPKKSAGRFRDRKIARETERLTAEPTPGSSLHV